MSQASWELLSSHTYLMFSIWYGSWSSGQPWQLHVHSLCPSSIADRLKEMEYRRVRVHGYFDHGKELYVWPRVLNTPRSGQGRAEHGTQVVSPFFCHSLKWEKLWGWVRRLLYAHSTSRVLIDCATILYDSAITFGCRLILSNCTRIMLDCIGILFDT